MEMDGCTIMLTPCSAWTNFYRKSRHAYLGHTDRLAHCPSAVCRRMGIPCAYNLSVSQSHAQPDHPYLEEDHMPGSYWRRLSPADEVWHQVTSDRRHL
jgi:hypothetical protein